MGKLEDVEGKGQLVTEGTGRVGARGRADRVYGLTPRVKEEQVGDRGREIDGDLHLSRAVGGGVSAAAALQDSGSETNNQEGASGGGEPGTGKEAADVGDDQSGVEESIGEWEVGGRTVYNGLALTCQLLLMASELFAEDGGKVQQVYCRSRGDVAFFKKGMQLGSGRREAADMVEIRFKGGKGGQGRKDAVAVRTE